MPGSAPAALKFQAMLNKVPEVTAYFWIIKVLCTTVGETFADYLNGSLNLGLTGTSLVMAALLAIVLFFQFRAKKYVPPLYWLAVVLISIVGTLITDNLTDNFGVSLITTTAIFSIALAAVFAAWYLTEKTLSVHSIQTARREAFYWLTILFTFALGTSVGDLVAERFDLGYLTTLGIFAGLIALVAVIHYAIQAFSGANARLQASYAVLAFWIAYVFTRPLGASIGDYLSQDKSAGGLGLGTTGTSFIFLGAILALVIYLSVSKKDQIGKIES